MISHESESRTPSNNCGAGLSDRGFCYTSNKTTSQQHNNRKSRASVPTINQVTLLLSIPSSSKWQRHGVTRQMTTSLYLGILPKISSISLPYLHIRPEIHRHHQHHLLSHCQHHHILSHPHYSPNILDILEQYLAITY